MSDESGNLKWEIFTGEYDLNILIGLLQWYKEKGLQSATLEDINMAIEMTRLIGIRKVQHKKIEVSK